MKVFISYSHQDAVALDRLHTHLAVLRRDGRIADWVDRDILAGGEIDAEIAERLESSGLFLLLVSPDFLASDYCFGREMQRAFERHRTGDARVVPIIVEPSDWKSTALRDLKALPRDGKPITEWTNENNAYLDVVQELRRILEADETSGTIAPEAGVEPGSARSGARRYRVQRDFDDIDRSDFQEEAFGAIRGYFESAVDEIDTVEDLRARFVSLSPTSFTCTLANRARRHGTAHITVHRRSGDMALGDITYSFTENASPNTASGMFSIESDEYDLFLSSLIGFGGHGERLTPEEAATQLWEEFLQQAGVASD